MSSPPLLVEDTNLSHAWFKLLELAMNSPKMEISPLIISLTDFKECKSLRNILDVDLVNNEFATTRTVSETIFPESIYQLVGKNRTLLYETYLNNLPRVKKLDKSNRNGTYFERLIAYEGKNKKINQLEIILKSLESDVNKRRSKLQASIFDPSKDHLNGPFQGFPCLQHVTFYRSSTGGIVLNSFYAIQYLYRRGYGNWLGLINLGKFVSNELGVEFERFNCFVGVEKLDLKKREARILLNSAN